MGMGMGTDVAGNRRRRGQILEGWGTGIGTVRRCGGMGTNYCSHAT